MGKLAKHIRTLRENAQAFGCGFALQCACRRLISFRCYEAYMDRWLTRYFAPVIERFRTCERPVAPHGGTLHVWTLWWQGEAAAPEPVRTCLESQRRMLAREGVSYHVLTRDNWRDYLELPDYMLEKVERGAITLTHFSDIIRAELLRKFGGVWIDATVYCTRPAALPEGEFFTVKTHERSDCLTLRRWTGFLIGDGAGSLLFDFMAEAFRYYWQREERLVVYLLIDHLIAIAYAQFPPVRERIDCVGVGDTALWEMMRRLNEPYDETLWNRVVSRTRFLKLSYKPEFNGGALREKTESGAPTYWGQIQNSRRA